MDIEDFRVMDVLGDTSLVLVGLKPERVFREDLHEDTSQQRQAIKLDSVCLSELITERENSVNDSFLHKQEENSLLQLSELCQDRRLSEETHNTHITCETDYIFVEQLLSSLKQ